MKISVVIPCFNSQNTIVRCLESVFNQTYLPYEVICIDDGSIDGTVDLIEILKNKYQEDFLIRIIKQENQGPSIARNKGVKLSEGDFIAFLDSDDVWHPKKLEISSKVVLDLNLDFLFHYYSPFPTIIDENLLNFSVGSKPRYKFALKNYIATPTVLLKKSIFIGFPEHLSYCEDYCCWLMLEENNFFYIDIPLANGFKKPIGDKGLSSNIFAMHKGFIEALKFLKKSNKINLFFFIVAYIFEFLKFPLRYLR